MGVGFLSPLFALGLAALAVPVIVHLVHRERKETTPFPSLMFLRRVPYRHSRRRKLRDLLLFAFRALAFLLAVAAFSRPVLDRVRSVATPGEGGKELVVLLDQSFSMSYPGRWTRAMLEARNIIATVSQRDRLTIVPFALSPHAANEATADRVVLGAALDSVRPTDGGTRYAPAIALARRILTSSRLPRRELVVISDFQRSGFDLTDEAALPPGTTVRGVDVVQGDVSDRAVRSVELRRTVSAGTEMLTVTARIGNIGVATRGVDVTLAVQGRPTETKKVDLPRDGGATVNFTPLPVPGASQAAQVRLAADGFPGDDAFNFVLERTPVVSVLVVEGPDARGERGIFLTRALEIGDHPPFEILVRASGVVTPNDVSGREVVILNDAVPSENVARRIAAAVQAGTGLIVATGERFGSSGSLATLRTLLPAPVRSPVDRAAERGAVLGYVDATHPALSLFGAARSGDLSAARFFRYRPLDSAAVILARFDDGAGALAERRVGKGRVLQFSSSLDGYWNDLPRQPVFLPFVHQLVRYAADYRERRNSYSVGEAIDARSIVDSVVTSGGAQVAESPSGLRIRFGGAGEPPSLVPGEAGAWQIRNVGRPGERPRLVAVNIDPRELEFARFDPARLASTITAAGGATEDEVVPEATLRRDRERDQSLWWYLLLGAAAALAGESILARRLSLARRSTA